MSRTIPQLPDGAPVQSTDNLIVDRSGVSYKIAASGFPATGMSKTGDTVTGQYIFGGTNNVSPTMRITTGSDNVDDVGLQLIKNLAKSPLDIHMNQSGGKAFRIWNKPVSGATWGTVDIPMQIGDRGNIELQSWITCTGTTSGTGDSQTFTQPTSDPYMIGIWADVDTGLVVRASNTGTGSNAQFFDRSGNYVLRVGESGELFWGTGLVKGGEDIKLYRASASVLRTDTDFIVGGFAARAPTLFVKAPTGQAPLFILQRNGSTAAADTLTVSVGTANQAYFTLGTAGVWRFQATPRSAAGSGLSIGVDDTSAMLVLDQNGCLANNVQGQIIRQKTLNTANLFETQDPASVVKFRVTKDHVAVRASLTIATLPTPAAALVGADSYATDGRKSGEGAGTGTGIPVWCDGTNWRTYYDNAIAAA